MAISKGENPNRKITVSEAEYARARRDRKRMIKLREALQPVNQVIKNILEVKDEK